MSETIGERLKRIRRERGLTQIDVYKTLRITNQTLSKYENGVITNIPTDKIEALAKLYSVSPSVIMGWEEKDEGFDLPDNAFIPKLKKVPMLGYAAAGLPLEDLNQDIKFVDIEDGIDVDFCITVRGDSMIGAGIDDGDIVFIKAMPSVENGQIACVEIDGERACLKRFYKSGNAVTLVSENPKYPPMILNEENCMDVKIKGLAVIKQSIIK